MSLLTEYPQLSNLKQSTQIITSLPFTSKPNSTTTNFHDFNIKNIFFRPTNDYTTAKTEAPSLSLLASKCSSAFQNLTRSEEENQLCSFSNSHTLPLSSFPSSHPSLHQHLAVHNNNKEEEKEEDGNKVNDSKKIKLPAFSQFITQNHLDSAFPSTSFAPSPSSSSCGHCNHHNGSPNSSSLYNNSLYPFNTPHYHHHHDRHQPRYDQSLYTQNQRSATPPLLYKAKHSSLLSINQPILSSSRSNSLPLLPINQPTNPELRTASTAPSSISSFKIVEFSNNKIQVNNRKGKEKQTITEPKTGASIISNDSENGTQQTKPTKRRRKIEKIDRKLKLDIKVPVKYDSKIIDLTRSVRNRFDSKLTF